MASRANKPISVTLGPLAEAAERRVRDGQYASVSEVLRAGLRALDREEEEDLEFEILLKRRVAEALADPRPPISLEQLDASIAQWHEDAVKRGA